MIGKYFVDNKHLKPRTALDAFTETWLSSLTTSAACHGRQLS